MPLNAIVLRNDHPQLVSEELRCWRRWLVGATLHWLGGISIENGNVIASVIYLHSTLGRHIVTSNDLWQWLLARNIVHGTSADFVLKGPM
jgi:hypothetical protein